MLENNINFKSLRKSYRNIFNKKYFGAKIFFRESKLWHFSQNVIHLQHKLRRLLVRCLARDVCLHFSLVHRLIR